MDVHFLGGANNRYRRTCSSNCQTLNNLTQPTTTILPLSHQTHYDKDTHAAMLAAITFTSCTKELDFLKPRHNIVTVTGYFKQFARYNSATLTKNNITHEGKWDRGHSEPFDHD